jgi:vacuolar protein sorting-associated protein 13A/C
VAFFLNALTMALGNVNDAPIRLNALVLENTLSSTAVLGDRIYLHYSQEFYSQLYRVVGSADFLGNPIGLFNNVSSGVVDIFYEPISGFVVHGNKELGIGIARVRWLPSSGGKLQLTMVTAQRALGALSKRLFSVFQTALPKSQAVLAKVRQRCHWIYGASDNAVTGLSAATLDAEWQSRRRMRQHRNKPKHALYGVTAGASSFVTSVASGFEGLAVCLTDPGSAVLGLF